MIPRQFLFLKSIQTESTVQTKAAPEKYVAAIFHGNEQAADDQTVDLFLMKFSIFAGYIPAQRL